jgi:hypothetical protein
MDASRNCQPCSRGNYCLGGDKTVNPNNTESKCPDGLTTAFSGAKSKEHCFTKPGYGRVSTRISDGTTSLSAVLCPVGTYNVGSNTAGCVKCGVGLTTATNGSTGYTNCSECARLGCRTCQVQPLQGKATTYVSSSSSSSSRSGALL